MTAEWQPTDKDREKIQNLAIDRSQAEIAKVFGVSLKTLRKHCAEELDTAKSDFDAIAIGGLKKAVINGNLVATMFYLKTQCRWREAAPKDDKPEERPKRQRVFAEIIPTSDKDFGK